MIAPRRGVLNKRLAERAFIAENYSIADIACYPWIVPHKAHGQDLGAFAQLRRWFDWIAARPATIRAYAGAADVYGKPQPLYEKARKILFGGAPAAAPYGGRDGHVIARAAAVARGRRHGADREPRSAILLVRRPPCSTGGDGRCSAWPTESSLPPPEMQWCRRTAVVRIGARVSV